MGVLKERACLFLLFQIALSSLGSPTQLECLTTKQVSLSVIYNTNSTGHPKLNARLEHPVSSTGWQLDVEHRVSGCGPGSQVSKILDLVLIGEPSSEARSVAGAVPGYKLLPGLGLYHEATASADWLGAKAACAAEGATLLLPANAREAQVLSSHFAFNASGATHTAYTWIAANDFQQEGRFVTDSGEPLESVAYSKIHPGQPDGGTGENCLVIVRSNALLADAPCSWKLPFICKLPL